MSNIHPRDEETSFHVQEFGTDDFCKGIGVMNTDRSKPPSAQYHFSKGADAAPVIMPLSGMNEDAASLVRFCRRACPEASILLPNPGRSGGQPAGAEKPSVFGLEKILRSAMKAQDISLIPLIAVGNGEGANLAASFALQHGSLLAGAILLRPSGRMEIAAIGALDGLPILLGLTPNQEMPGAAGGQLKSVLSAAGAQLICERVADRPTAGGNETALARVFIASLFGR